jgi:hypothetical protein
VKLKQSGFDTWIKVGANTSISIKENKIYYISIMRCQTIDKVYCKWSIATTCGPATWKEKFKRLAKHHKCTLDPFVVESIHKHQSNTQNTHTHTYIYIWVKA